MIRPLIPLYNQEKILPEKLSWLSEWAAKPSNGFEIIVVDNGSADQSEAIGRSNETTQQRFR